MVAGVQRTLDAIERFHFDDELLSYLDANHVVDDTTLAWLASYRFSGDVWGYAEGEVYFPYSPLMTVDASFGEAVLLETVLLSILNHDSAIASAASRMTWAANGRPCIEMGSRRTHELSAVAAARAAYVAGFATTSNLAAGRGTAFPTTGTSAHSFTLLHETEREAFTAQVAALGRSTSLLVDTYRHRRGCARRRGDRRAGAGRGPHRLRRPRHAGPAGPRPARRLGDHEDPDHRHLGPRRVRDRRAGLCAGRRLRSGHFAGHRQRAPDVRLRLQARVA